MDSHTGPLRPTPETSADDLPAPGVLATARSADVRGTGAAGAPPAGPDAEERILAAAYGLFSRRGIRDVGVTELIDTAGVAKATFYRHFRSKDDVVLAFLARRDQLWTLEQIIAGARARGTTPTQQLLAIFDVFADWFAREDFEACTFINVLLEMGSGHRLGRASIDYLARIRGHVRALAEEAGLDRADEFARSWHILMKGSIISAAEGDADAAARARQMAGWLIEHHQP
ncbi:TetR/AcrR family transcriptional regulator [Arthrobacter sp. C9C5]|uniref:TetR/AcrR family transcriptional regulator n=1 Tax=Arthrobacter sp. C9C5 TaxID=2735267 RepID=UPI00158583E1|nr:TetR/AcrR family transcriptional regulator [Arthrobacter sp. C9C5]NUU33069.1 TetR/AcrR family transcriptional regulator [Arthrobacter sp. C9C5]